MSLSQMSTEELWQLFPIVLTEHNDEWTKWYAEEAARITELLHIEKSRISHIGSTAISQICAKPIIDILLEIAPCASMEAAKEKLASGGYICMCEEPERKDFNRGYTETGFAERVFHLHLRFRGDNDELYFRDYLIERPDIAHEYEKMKLLLWKKYEHNRDAYTDAKTEFIKKYTDEAKMKYGNRY